MSNTDVDSMTIQQVGSTQEGEQGPEAGNSSGGGPGWLALIGACAVLLVGGAAVAAWMGADDTEESEESVVDEPDDGFQPYAGGSAPADLDERDEEPGFGAVADDAPEQNPGADESDEPERPISEGLMARENRPVNMQEGEPEAPANINELEPDGVNILEDEDGNPISREEAEERLMRDLEGIEEADEDFQRRLRRRDVEMNSRILRQREDGGGVEPIPGIQLSDQVQQRLSEQLGEIDDD